MNISKTGVIWAVLVAVVFWVPLHALACALGEAKKNIEWVLVLDKGAQASYVDAAKHWCDDRTAILYAQRHNKGARESIRACWTPDLAKWVTDYPNRPNPTRSGGPTSCEKKYSEWSNK